MRLSEQSAKSILTIKVLEVDDKHPLSRPNYNGTTKSTRDISNRMPTVRPSEGQSFETSDENSDKNSGKQSKQKRKASELEEDKLLWAKLKSGA